MTFVMNGLTAVEFRTPVQAPQREYTTVEEAHLAGGRSAIEDVGTRDVILNPGLMAVDQPYPYRLEGVEYWAVLRSGGRLDFYELPAPRA